MGYQYAGGEIISLDNLACETEVSISDRTINNFLNAIFQGVIDQGSVDRALWEKTYKEIYSSFESGYGKSLASVKFNSPDWEYLQNLKYNTAIFSAFKQNNAIKDAAKLLFDDQGNARSWREFRDKAMEVSDTYNKRWLQTEYNQAHSSAVQARRWRDFENTADLYPNLIYIAVMDQRTRPEHAKLHGTILPITDPFWNTYAPPNGWGCRCTLRRTDKAPTGQPQDIPSIPKAFQVNPGKEAKVFSDNHPYVRSSQDRANEIMAFVNTQIKSVGEIRNSFNEFSAYGPEYTRAAFNGSCGGYSVYHEEHSFDKKFGHLEKDAYRILANNGTRVVALPETGIGKHIDCMVLDNKKKYELKSITANTSLAVKDALEIAFKKQLADNVLLYWPRGVDMKILGEGVDRFIGHARKSGIRIGTISYINAEGRIVTYLK